MTAALALPPALPVVAQTTRGSVRLRRLSAAERAEYWRTDASVAWLVARCLVDETGGRLFADDEIPTLATCQAALLAPIAARARRLNGLDDDAVPRAVAQLEADGERRFAFRWARAIGCPHPDLLLPLLTSQQFAECLAFEHVEPCVEARADLNAGIIAATIANCHRDPEKRPDGYAPADFMPTYGLANETDEADDVDPVVAKMLTYAELYSRKGTGPDAIAVDAVPDWALSDEQLAARRAAAAVTPAAEGGA